MAAGRTNVVFHEVQRFGLWLRLLVAALMLAAVVIDSFALRTVIAGPNPADLLNIILLVARSRKVAISSSR